MGVWENGSEKEPSADPHRKIFRRPVAHQSEIRCCKTFAGYEFRIWNDEGPEFKSVQIIRRFRSYTGSVTKSSEHTECITDGSACASEGFAGYRAGRQRARQSQSSVVG